MKLDFVCCLDGDVLIGEAKKADKLEEGNAQEREVLVKYKDLAGRVGAKAVVLNTFSLS